MSRAFFYAGADSVVASLWSVNDQSTASLMTAFYGALGRGASAAGALRQAKLALLTGPERMRAPYYWAPFVALGDGNWSGAPPVQPWRAFLAQGIVLLAGVAAMSTLALITWRRVRKSRTHAR